LFDETADEVLRRVLSDHDDGLELLAGAPQAWTRPLAQFRIGDIDHSAPRRALLAGRYRQPVLFTQRYSLPGSVFQHKADREVSFRR
jgi:hypothetical protein